LAEIIEGAKLVGDKNPIHHDTNHTNSKFDGILASGSHISAVFSALIPTHFSQYGNVVGLNMSFQFKLPIYPNRKYTMEWKVCEKEVNGKLNGTIYYLTGAIVGLIIIKNLKHLAIILSTSVLFSGCSPTNQFTSETKPLPTGCR